ncbi:uncharacterized protein LOC144178067 isoform X1 [Haemaphysalis longicornis]
MANVLKSPMSETYWPQDVNRNFGGYILDHLRRSSNSKLINATKHEEWTYAEVADKAVGVHAALSNLGLGEGDRICAMVTPRLELLPLFVGAACANVAFVYKEPGYTVDFLVDHLESFDLAAISCDSENTETALALQGRLPTVKHVIVMDTSASKPEKFTGNVLSWNELLDLGSQACRLEQPLVKYIEKQFCYIPSTSGTTGKPKTVIRSHESLVAGVRAMSHPSHMGLTEKDVLLAVSPLAHAYGLIAGVCKAIVQGASAAFLETQNMDGILQALEYHKVSALNTAPHMLMYLLDHPKREQFDLSHLRHVTSAGDYISETVSTRLFKELKLKSFIQMYGQNETGIISAGLYDAPPKFTSVGRLALGIEAMVVDTVTGQPFGAGHVGEIVVRGPGLALGYWGRVDESFLDSEGWHKTGDLGYFDAEEWLYVVQRMNDFYFYRGWKVIPGEIEAVLLKHPEVQECGVVGIPDAEAPGQLSHAAVILKPGATISDPNNFVEFVKENAPEKNRLVGGVSIVDKLPRTKLGKLLRPQLLQQILEKLHGTESK